MANIGLYDVLTILEIVVVAIKIVKVTLGIICTLRSLEKK